MKPILAAFAIAGLGIVISVNGDLAAETRSVEKELSNLNKKLNSIGGHSQNGTLDTATSTPDGAWIGRMVVDKESSENCSFDFKNIKANFSNQIMTLHFQNSGSDIKLDLPLNEKGTFSEWQGLIVQLLDLAKLYDREFRFSGEVKGNILTGSFFVEVTRVGDTCGGDMYFVKKGTLEAKAFLTNRDVRVVRLEHRLEMIKKSVTWKRR